MHRLAAVPLSILLLGPAPLSGASAQEAAQIWQQIRDHTYAKCMADARFGAAPELQANCSCAADVVMDRLSDGFKQAIADGTHAGFKGPKLKGDAQAFNTALVETCPKVGAYLP